MNKFILKYIGVLYFLCVLSQVSAIGSNPVGFVIHPHEDYYEKLNKTSATAELANVFVWRMKDEPNQIVDFSVAEKWLDNLYESKREAYPILDTGIHHSDHKWQRKIWEENDSFLIGADGAKKTYASFHSNSYKKVIYNYIDQLIDWIVENDTRKQIPAYVNGAEWFWPWGDLDYSEMAIDAFRVWLKNKYESLDKLNKTWGAKFKSWDDVEPLRVTMVGDVFTGMLSMSLDGPREFSWTSPVYDIRPNSNYKLNALAKTEGVPEGLFVVEFLWMDENGNVLTSNQPRQGDVEGYSLNLENDNSLQKEIITTSPINASKVKVSFVLFGHGKAEVKDIKFKSYPENKSIFSTSDSSFDSSEWISKKTKKAKLKVFKKGNEVVFSYNIPKMKTDYRNPSVSWEDWNVFSFEAMANWLNTTAKHIKEKDPTRKVSSYVGWVFGSHSMWEGCMTIQRLDISLANTPNIEINGIQTCIAGDDYTYATFPIDMARKYNKPINLTDMVDFPYGLYSGFDAIYKGCMASVQHGMDGLFAYCWYAKWPPAYNYYTHLTARENEILLTDTQNAIESLKNYQLNTKVAFLMPLMTFSLADENGRKGDNLDNFGLYHLVLDTGYMPDVITTYELEKGIIDSLSKYRVIFLPDCPVISPENNKTLIEYVQNGGTIISSGQLPEYDLAYKKLENGFSSKFKISKNGIELVGKGKVVNINDKIGRSYMGKVRRWREAGNTPQVYMRLDRSRKEKIRRDFVRNKFYERVKSTGFTPDVIIPSQKHSVHIATYKNEKTESDKVMFVNKGKRVKSLEVILSNRFSSRNKANAFVDFDKSYPVEINEGVLRLPPFTTSIILTFEK